MGRAIAATYRLSLMNDLADPWLKHEQSDDAKNSYFDYMRIN